MSVDISIVTPAFNEAENLLVLYERLKFVMTKNDLTWNWVVVDDHSTDDTFDVLNEMATSGIIAKKNRGLNSAFTVRKISHGEGVERVFQTHSSMIDSVSVKRSGKVRKAKLYYLRGLTGKAARIKEKLKKK